VRDLPIELIKSIINLVPQEDLRSHVRLVSRLFFDIVGQRNFDLGLIMPSEMEQVIRVFGRYNNAIGLSFNKLQKLSSEDMNQLTVLTHLTSLRAKENICNSTLVHLTTLEELKVLQIDITTLQQLSKLTSLQAKINVSDTSNWNGDQLKSFDLINRSDNWSNMTCRNVTSLILRSKLDPPVEWLEQFKQLNSLTVGNLGTKSDARIGCLLPPKLCNLTSLSLGCAFLKNKPTFPWHQLMSLSMALTPELMDSTLLYNVPHCTNLTSLCISATSIRDKDLLKSLAIDGLKLQGLTVLISGRPPFGCVRDVLRQAKKETLRALDVTIWHEHQKCIAEISYMTNLESLKLCVRRAPPTFEADDVSPLMTLTQLTTLVLMADNCRGLESITKLTTLNDLVLPSAKHSSSLDTFNLSTFTNLTRLVLENIATKIHLRGPNRLKKLALDSSLNTECAVELVPEDMDFLKEILIGTLSTPIPWIDLSKCTALDTIVCDTFETGDSVAALEKLKRLTRLGNYDLFWSPQCMHFNVCYLTGLTRLQSVELIVPPHTSQKDMIMKNMPHIVHYKEEQCRHTHTNNQSQ
jgi:hypothetical protein